ncbi:MAG TPA: hypothetical protein VJ302_10835 [Blastocatellia bacterium]|nr:hypothetical protein [Blastocatellia bacterium]
MFNKKPIFSAGDDSLRSSRVPAWIKHHLLAITGFSIALFLPLMGHGFVLDDFAHLHSAAYDPLWHGLTRATGGWFYAPAAWVTYKIDWMLWGWSPFSLTATNLLLHLANIILLYLLALKLWRSRVAAKWAAFGFALLFPANTWAVMWISTRAHLIVTLSYLAAMLAALWLARTDDGQVRAALTIVAFTALAVFSKESGILVPAAVGLVLLHEMRSQDRRVISLRLGLGLLAAIGLVLAAYFALRAQSGAVRPTFSSKEAYYYVPSLKLLIENLVRYTWRTYGLLAILAGALALAQYLRAGRLRFGGFNPDDAWLSLLLFAITIAPFTLLPVRSGIYSYLPGIAAALLLGACAKSFEAVPRELSPRRAALALSPIVAVVAVLAAFTVGHSLKWRQMARTNAAVLNQITAYHPQAGPNTWFTLHYAEVDYGHRFPDSIDWAFPYALRLIYADPTLDGRIVRHGAPNPAPEMSPQIHFTYTSGGEGRPQVTLHSTARR